MNDNELITYNSVKYPESEMLQRSESFYEWLNKRRTVRDFSTQPVPTEIINNIVAAASTAPSGANKQPWTFCIVSSKEMKQKIREAAEKEEIENYNGRMSERWIKDLEHLATNEVKEFLTAAPHLIVVFKRAYETDGENKINNYYVNESVGLAAGFLITAIHNAGLVSVTHTPSPMNFLTKILERPENERPFLLIPIGYPAKDVKVPNISRKPLTEVVAYY